MKMKPLNHSLYTTAIVPGLPHILQRRNMNKAYDKLAQSMSDLSQGWAEAGVKRILYYSTQWMSVLGQSFQAKADLKGMHVDENWYEYGDLPFAFQIDAGFAGKMADTVKGAGFATALVNFDGFPVDTGTIVADKFLNPSKRFKSAMVSCCVYSDYNETYKLGQTIRQAIDKDGTPTAVVGVSSLSGRFFTTEIDLREDHVRDPNDDQWNRRIIDLLGQGKHTEIKALVPEYSRAARVDMGFKAYGFLTGILDKDLGTRQAQCLSYGPIYGTGAAVITW